jgi:hypothetical protein
MKKMLVLIAASWVGAWQGRAEFKMPKSVFRMNQLEEAKAAAQEKGCPITFISTHEKTSCGLCASASVCAAEELDKKTVVVYVDCDGEKPQLPKIVQDALRKPEAGRYVPKTVIVDPEITKVITIVPYATGAEQQTLLKQAKKQISQAMPKKTSKPSTSAHGPARSAIEPDENREMRVWRSKNGAELTGSLFKEKGSYLVLRKEDGTQRQILMSELSDEDQKYVRELKENAEKALQQENPPAEK